MSQSQIENALMDSLSQLVDLQQQQGETLQLLALEQQSAHERMNTMQEQINQLAESLRQSVNWQSELIARLNALESLFERSSRK